MQHAPRYASLVCLALIVAACIPQARLNKAVLKLESEWKTQNDQYLQSDGRRFYTVTKEQGFAAAQLAASRVGMVVEKQDYNTGFLLVSSPAPVPLTMQEWSVVQETDTKQMRSIVGEEVGVFSWWVTLDPSGKDVLANVFVKEVKGGVDVSVGLRLRFRSATTDKLRRMQPPPSAVRIGVNKFWTAIDGELAAIVAKEPAHGEAPAAVADVPVSVSPQTNAAPTPRPLGQNPDAVAVVIGNKTYGGRVPAVDFAHNDAESMKQFFVAVLGLSEANVIDLRDAKLADMEAVLGNARTYKGKLWRWVRPHESDVFVFYSGHGVPGMKDGREYLLPVDGDPDTPELKGYPTQLLYENLAHMEARSVTVMLEACFSGESPRGPLMRDASGIRVAPKDVVTAEITVLAAARSNQVASWDKETEHGLFTRHLIDALSGAADSDRYGKADGRVTLEEVRGYLDREMTYAARRNYGRDQQAMVYGVPDKVIVSLGR
jgi:hypothetical protein